MTASKAMTANLILNQKATDAVLEALKEGLTKEEVAAVLARLIEILENADGE